MVANSYPYDKDGYCVYCRIGQYKPHTEACDYRRSVEKAKAGTHTMNPPDWDLINDQPISRKTEAF